MQNFITNSSKNLYLTSKNIRKHFIEYFQNEYNHKFVRSSPVIPYCDPTVAFVNAGMIQFKNIFLGKVNASHKRVVNSQKCIRVGGKHNDLSIVGTDGYHHTFFEMLGNWSFGDYFKQDACHMAWRLLKDVYKIDTNRLFVTYFGGNKSLNLMPDLECREIWRSIGVPDDRIIPFDMKDNFWEMGPIGPCGPCSEIHIDHLQNCNRSSERAKYVNAGIPDLTELWNIVFIQYNRNSDGSITPLPQRHIDTGMGFERLVAILQNKISNYDTDLFIPIFTTIENITKSPSYNYSFNVNDTSYSLDTAYRILGDHSRMITACLADGMFPDQNHKLRKLIRKTILISERSFKHNNLLYETIPQITEILGDTYPEIEKNYHQIIELVRHEEEVFQSLRKNVSEDLKTILQKRPDLRNDLELVGTPGFINGFNELEQLYETKNFNQINELSFKLYDTYGLDIEMIEKLYKLFNLNFNYNEFEHFLKITRNRTKSLHSAVNTNKSSSNLTYLLKFVNIQKTHNEVKYEYEYNKLHKRYNLKPVETHVVGIVESTDERLLCVDQTSNSNRFYYLITASSPFYYESGGQEADSGTIEINKNIIDIVKIDCIDGFVLHKICVDSDVHIKLNDQVKMMVNEDVRSKNTINHTATHILNATVRNILNCAVCQKSSVVTSEALKLELGIFGVKLDRNKIEKIENQVREIIQKSLAINKYTINSEKLLEIDHITLVPGEVYPDENLRVLEIYDPSTQFVSRELCCGTHAANTIELQDFCITNVKMTGRGTYVINAVAGNVAHQAHLMGEQILVDTNKIRADLELKKNLDNVESRLQRLKNLLTHGNEQMKIPYTIKVECMEILNDVGKQLKEISKENLKEFVEIEMKNVLDHKSQHPFIVHYLQCSSLMDSVSLQKATKCCTDRSILVISLTDGIVKARCCVPKDKTNTKFNAGLWMTEIAKVFRSSASPPKGQNIEEVCNLKAKKVKSTVFEEQLEQAIVAANSFAKKYLTE